MRRLATRTVLLDAGLGPARRRLGRVEAIYRRELAAHGVAPEDIDIVVASATCTLDHIGWLAANKATAMPFFPNATVRYGHADWDQFVDRRPTPRTARAT